MDRIRVVVVAPDAVAAELVARALEHGGELGTVGVERFEATVVVLGESSEDPEGALAEQRVGALTRREREVLQELVDGRSPAAMATCLHISLNTARAHVKHVLAKLEVTSSLEAVSLGVRAGMRPSGSLTER